MKFPKTVLCNLWMDPKYFYQEKLIATILDTLTTPTDLTSHLKKHKNYNKF